MYCLNEDMTRVRRTYRPPLPTLPAICVIWVPPIFERRELGLGRFFPVVLETDEEAAEFEAFLAAPRPGPVTPNLLNLRPSRLAADAVTLAAYFAPEPEWPHILLFHAPASDARNADPAYFIRQGYIIEMYATEDELAHAAAEMTAAAGHGPGTIITLAPSSMTSGMA